MPSLDSLMVNINKSLEQHVDLRVEHDRCTYGACHREHSTRLNVSSRSTMVAVRLPSLEWHILFPIPYCATFA